MMKGASVENQLFKLYNHISKWMVSKKYCSALWIVLHQILTHTSLSELAKLMLILPCARNRMLPPMCQSIHLHSSLDVFYFWIHMQWKSRNISHQNHMHY